MTVIYPIAFKYALRLSQTEYGTGSRYIYSKPDKGMACVFYEDLSKIEHMRAISEHKKPPESSGR
jgi:hypothetical protein